MDDCLDGFVQDCYHSHVLSHQSNLCNRNSYSDTKTYWYWIGTHIDLSWDPFYEHWLTFIPAWTSNHMPSKMWDKLEWAASNGNRYPQVMATAISQ